MKHQKSIALLMAGWIACSGVVHADDSAHLEFPEVAKAPILPGKPLNRLFYFPTRDQPATPKQWGHRFRQVEITSEDGTKLHGWWIESKVEPVIGTVVFSHGNAGSIGHHLGFVTWLATAGYEVLMYDYRGYGKSEGKIERSGMVQDARAALEFAGNSGHNRNMPIISYGHSLGGAKSLAAIAGGKTKNLRAVITDATFASYREMAMIIGGRLAASLVSDELAPVDLVDKISPLPLLIVHGEKDPVVPISQGRKLFRAAEKPKTIFEVKDGHHGDNLWRDQGAYRKKMLEWLEKSLQG